MPLLVDVCPWELAVHRAASSLCVCVCVCVWAPNGQSFALRTRDLRLASVAPPSLWHDVSSRLELVQRDAHSQRLQLKFAARHDPSSSIGTRISWRTSKKFPWYYPNPGYAHTSQYNTVPLLALLFRSLRWHEHDATEIQEECDCDKVVEL